MRNGRLERLAWIALGALLGFFGTLTLQKPRTAPSPVAELQSEVGALRLRVAELEVELGRVRAESRP